MLGHDGYARIRPFRLLVPLTERPAQAGLDGLQVGALRTLPPNTGHLTKVAVSWPAHIDAEERLAGDDDG